MKTASGGSGDKQSSFLTSTDCNTRWLPSRQASFGSAWQLMMQSMGGRRSEWDFGKGGG
jgi:hypothetical protein